MSDKKENYLNIWKLNNTLLNKDGSRKSLEPKVDMAPKAQSIKEKITS